MSLPEATYIWMDGEFVEWKDAQVHVLTHSLHYGNAVFEGIRAYQLADGGTGVFRLREHYERLERSARGLTMEPGYSVDELCDVTLELLRKNGSTSGYIRPLVYRGYGSMGVYPGDSPVKTMIAAWEWGAYLGPEALENGIDAGVSSWRQRSANEMPPAIKSSGNYLNSSLAKIEAVQHGYGEAILLNQAGFVAEGSGENLFVVRDGVLMTPPGSDGILEGITRASVMEIALDLDIPVLEESLLRTDLYMAEEAFFTGTAAELTPIRSIDGRPIPCPGEYTKAIQDVYFKAAHGDHPDYEHWVTRI